MYGYVRACFGDNVTYNYVVMPHIEQGFPETTTTEALDEAHRLKSDFQTRATHKLPVNTENFTQSLAPRNTGI